VELSFSTDSYLDELVSSLNGKIFSKNVAYLDSIVVPTSRSGTPDLTTKNLYSTLLKAYPEKTQSTILVQVYVSW
jgi:hypothetical protein